MPLRALGRRPWKKDESLKLSKRFPSRDASPRSTITLGPKNVQAVNGSAARDVAATQAGAVWAAIQARKSAEPPSTGTTTRAGLS